MKNKKINYIDIFAWCGWLSLGFYNSKKRKWIFAIEKSTDAFETLKHNLILKKNHYDRPSNIPCENYEINEFMDKYSTEISGFENKVDLIMWWPPCQGFSLAGKRKHNDTRNSLVHSYISFVEKVKPKAVFFENVSWFTLPFKWQSKKNYSKDVIEKLTELWYQVESKVVDFSEYWIPQKRKRFILVWFLWEEKKNFFELLDKEKKKFLEKKWLNESISIEEAISDLEKKNWIVDSSEFIGFKIWKYWKIKSSYQKFLRNWVKLKMPDSHRFANHTNRVEERFWQIIKRKLSPDDIKKTFWLKKNSTRLLLSNLPAPTLTTLPDDCVHYSEPRILTVREYARIQSFNDWFEFKGKYTTWGKQRTKETPRYTQIWNAIPPLFGELVGNVLSKLLN